MSVVQFLDKDLNKTLKFKPNLSIDANTPKLLQADATCKTVLEAESVDLIVTSPPYNVGKAYNGNEAGDALHYNDYADFSKKWLENCFFLDKVYRKALR